MQQESGAVVSQVRVFFDGSALAGHLMHRITSDPRAGKVTDTKHQCFKNHTEAADGKIFWLSAAPV